MSLLLASALAVSGAVLPQCSWDRPGANPFQGDVVAAVDRYVDIPSATRAALKRRIAARQYDEIADITRDGIAGKHRYSDLRDMHFGQGTVCRTVTRTRWQASTLERGLVYCEDGHCLIVPTVCRNVSRVTREAKPTAKAIESAPLAAAPQIEPIVVATMPTSDSMPDEDLRFEPPGAGEPASFAEGAGLASPLAAAAGPEFALPSVSLPGLPGFAPGFGGLPPSSPALAGLSPVPGVLPSVSTNDVVTPVPEPSALFMAGLAGMGLIWLRRSRSFC